MTQKRTAFYDIHVRLGGKIVPFAGFDMPVQYTGILEEHKRVRERVGVFDVSHMGEVEIRGKGALAFVQKVTINDAAKLTEGRVQYSAMCYEDGGIVDDLLVYHLGDHYMMVINAANTAKDIDWLRRHADASVDIRDVSDAISLLAVQGPDSVATLKKLTAVDLAAIPYYHCTRGRLAGTDMLISRTGYTGETGFELYFPSDPALAATIWDAVMEAGKEFLIGPAGLGARDTLRLEMGYCLYGHDIDQTTNPLEAGLGWITKTDKGPFLGRDALVRVKQEGVKRKLVGFTIDDRAFPRQGYAIRSNGGMIGSVTSGTFSPVLNKGIGMGYVETGHAKPGTPVSVVIRDRGYGATIVPLPFVKK